MRQLNLLMSQLTEGKISRRTFVMRASALGLSLPVISAALAACNGTSSDDADDDAATADDTADDPPADDEPEDEEPADEDPADEEDAAEDDAAAEEDEADAEEDDDAAADAEPGTGGEVVWVSPRGTLEVLDDYPYWIADHFGWFGDIETTMEPGPMEATSTARLVDQGQADVGYPSPGVFTLALEAGVSVVSVFQMGAYDTFGFAFRPDSDISSIEDLAGKEISLGDAGWESIANPILAYAGIDPSEVNYVEAGPGWAQAVDQGQADAALTWEGLRAQWEGIGLEFNYILGKDFSPFPANSFVIRREDLEDEELMELYGRYLRGWAMGLEFAHLNPRAATQITMDVFPALEDQMTPEIAVESLLQQQVIFRGDWDAREGWGWHDFEGWRQYLESVEELGQVSESFEPEDILSNDLVPIANDFDHDEVQQAAEEFELRPEYEEIDVDAIRERV